MSDDLVQSAATHGVTLLTGGGLSAWLLKQFFGGVEKRLASIEATLAEQGKTADARHESMIERVVRVESKADAAHRRQDDFEERLSAIGVRLDELAKGRRR